ncbi:MAG: hypothetical protein KDB32_05060 [Planctomycetes bacterium]|nr:hypothetical protein [Planctomycetota bacterium]
MFKAFKATSSEVEVDGRTVLAVTSGILVADVARELLESVGMVDIKPDGWYVQQMWLDAYRRIHDYLGADTLYSIGRRIPYSAQFPDEKMFDVPSALESIDVAYHMAHRGGEIGHYKYVEAGFDHYEIHCDNPYANEFDLGIIVSLVERFRGRLQFDVRYKQAAANPDEDNACVVEIVRV